MRTKLLILICLLAPRVFAAEDLTDRYRGVQEHADKFEAHTREHCSHPIRFEVSDFLFQRDELEAFSSWAIEQGQILSRLIDNACSRSAANRKILSAVNTIYMKRGSLDERKLVRIKNGDLMYFAANDPKQASKNWDEVIREDLITVLALDFKTSPTAEPDAKRNAETQKQVDASKAKVDAQKAKMAELQTWYQAELKRVMAKSPPNPAELETLTKSYTEKLNAILTPR